MILYNVTVNVADEVHEEWVDWMRTVHIQDVMNTGCFIKYKFCRLIRSQEEGTTYSIQYFCKDMATLHSYQVKFSQKLQADHQSRFKDKCVAFRSLLEVIEEQ